MIRRSRMWLVLDGIFILGNVAGAVFALAAGEGVHAATHVALAVLGVYMFSWITPRIPALPAAANELADGLTRLQNSVDTIAIEVERIGEGQRFVTQFLSESGDGSAAKAMVPDSPTNQRTR